MKFNYIVSRKSDGIQIAGFYNIRDAENFAEQDSNGRIVLMSKTAKTFDRAHRAISRIKERNRTQIAERNFQMSRVS